MRAVTPELEKDCPGLPEVGLQLLVGLEPPFSPVSTLMSLCLGDTYLTSGEGAGEDGDCAVGAGGAVGTTEEFRGALEPVALEVV